MAITNYPIRTGFGRMLYRRKITTKALAKALGYSVPAVKSWRMGTREPQRGALLLCADYLGMSSAHLLRLLRERCPVEADEVADA